MTTTATTDTIADAATALVITPAQFLAHWQGHRKLTRRAIEAFPDDQLYSFSLAGLRPFGVLANELLGMAVPTVQGMISDTWGAYAEAAATTKQELLAGWDASTAQLETLFPQIPEARFQATMTAFGQWTMPGYDLLLYVVDNEVHHRGQGYVYLRALGIEPPAFWER
ncbi:MAG TPA: DinB family protein [Gemmatimonas sp.]|nr:DinB family protein [Gemmatimonas sp.]